MSFPRRWTAEVLAAPPLIAPVRQFVFPRQVAGEEDTLARGALLLSVRPATGGSFLATCALGFQSASLTSGVMPSPSPDLLCALAGGYVYMVDTLQPERTVQVELRPVVEVREAEAAGLLLFVGFHEIVAWDAEGFAWKTARLSWEGVRLTELTEREAVGLGWEMRTDREMEFRIDLTTGTHTGGGYAEAARG